MLNRRKFLLGSTAMVAAAVLPVPKPAYAGLTSVQWEAMLGGLSLESAAENYYCHVPSRVFCILNDGLMYWSDGALDGWKQVGDNFEAEEHWQPFDKSALAGVATLPEIAS